jgi:uncharacterized protein (DUF1697 family)
MSSPIQNQSSTTYVALLRGINVGGNNKIEMAKLKQTFERLGFLDVKTFIASGNVIFRADSADQAALAQKTEAAITADFGLSIGVLLCDLKKMRNLVQEIPSAWQNDKTMRCDVMFLWPEVDNERVLEQLPFNSAIEDVKYFPGAVVWRIDRENVARSRMSKIIGTKVYRQMTARNVNTTRKLHELMLACDAATKNSH